MELTEEDTLNALRRTPFNDVLQSMYWNRAQSPFYKTLGRRKNTTVLDNFASYLFIELNEEMEYDELTKHFWTTKDFVSALVQYLKQVDDQIEKKLGGAA